MRFCFPDLNMVMSEGHANAEYLGSRMMKNLVMNHVYDWPKMRGVQCIVDLEEHDSTHD